MMKLEFDKPLKYGIIQLRSSQFIMSVLVDDRIEKAHCPTTGRIGDIELKGVACLMSVSNDRNRKTKYTVEAISVDNLDVKEKRWIGINQIYSNKYVEFLLETHQLDEMVKDYHLIKREVNLGVSKLDFLVGNTYLEVKSPLQTLQIEYGTNIKRKKMSPFSSTDRMVKHINELAGSLRESEKAILLVVFQYDNTGFEVIHKSTNYEQVKAQMSTCIEKGIEVWQVNMRIDETGIALTNYFEITNRFI